MDPIHKLLRPASRRDFFSGAGAGMAMGLGTLMAATPTHGQEIAPDGPIDEGNSASLILGTPDGELEQLVTAPAGAQLLSGGANTLNVTQITQIVGIASRTFTFRENSNTPGRQLEQAVVVNRPSGAGFFVMLPYFNGAFTNSSFTRLRRRGIGQFFVSAFLRGNNLVCRVRLTDDNADDPVFIQATAIVVFFR